MMVVFLHPGLNTAFALCFAFMLYALLLFAFSFMLSALCFQLLNGLLLSLQ
jgi:hypothetical protein